MEPVMIYDAVRTPRGRVRKGGGTLSSVPAAELLAGLMAEVEMRGALASAVNDVIIGVSTPFGEQGGDLARVAVLLADWPEDVSGGVVSRMCCSGLDAIASGAARVAAGMTDLVAVGGAESMSRTPMLSDAPSFAADDTVGDLTGFVTIGVAADLMAARFEVDRSELETYAVQSHERSLSAPQWDSLVPVLRDGVTILGHDEGARPNLTVEDIAALPSMFADDPLWRRALARFGDRIAETSELGVHSLATAPQLADAASMAILGTRAAGSRLGLVPRGRVVSWAHAAVRSPGLWAGESASQKALALAGLAASSIAVAELNESFAVTPIVLTKQLGLSPEIVNACGGAVAVGHPLGASGGILLANALDRLARRGGGHALLVIPAALGLATAVIVEGGRIDAITAEVNEVPHN